MNQILVTEKLYITPELKRKKKIYKFNFLLSVFFICVLISIYFYAEFDRNKSEEVSHGIMEAFDENTEDTTVAKSNVLLIVLDDEGNNVSGNTTNSTQSNNQNNIQNSGDKKKTTNKKIIQTTAEGYRYTTIATINIPKIGVQYPILDGQTDSVEETKALLKISPTKFWGAEPNQVGNFCVVGHNYRNTKFFSKVPTLVNGDIIEITDLSGKTLRYSVYNKYEVVPEDTSCTTQITKGRTEITLITCTNDSKMRVIVKAKAI